MQATGVNVPWEFFSVVLIPLVGWVIRKAWVMHTSNIHSKINEGVSAHRKYADTTYATKEELKETEKRSEGAVSNLKADIRDMEDRIMTGLNQHNSNITDLLKQLISGKGN